MIQVLPFQMAVSPNTSDTTFGSLLEGLHEAPTTSEDAQLSPWPVTGTLRAMRIALTVAPGSGKSWTFTVRVNQVDTEAAITISDTETTGLWQGLVSVASGDLIALKIQPSGTPSGAPARITVEFDSDASNESGYALGRAVSSVDAMVGAFGAGATNATVGANADVATICPIEATVTQIEVYVSGGAGASTITCDVYKNGTLQDGSGGSVDAQVIVVLGDADGGTGSKTLSLPIDAGDDLMVRFVRTSGNTRRVHWSMRLQADTPGESVVAVKTGTPPSAASESWAPIRSGEDASAYQSSTNISHAAISGVTEFTLSKMYVRALDGAPGAGASTTFSVDVDGVTSALAVTLSDSDTDATNTSDSASVGPNETIALSHVPASTPSVGSALVSMAMTTELTLRGSHVWGESTRVTASRSVAFGLDGSQHTHSEEGKAKIYGKLDVTEETRFGYFETDPSSPEDGTAWLQVVSGSPLEAYLKARIGGSTETLASFPTSSAESDRVFGWTFDGAGSALTTGTKSGAAWRAPVAGTITRVSLLADQSGDLVIDIWKDTLANYPPTDADSITSASPPTLSSGTSAEDTTLSGWTTSFSAGDIFLPNIDSVATIERATLLVAYTPA